VDNIRYLGAKRTGSSNVVHKHTLPAIYPKQSLKKYIVTAIEGRSTFMKKSEDQPDRYIQCVTESVHAARYLCDIVLRHEGKFSISYD
jgi:hypothetical protein